MNVVGLVEEKGLFCLCAKFLIQTLVNPNRNWNFGSVLPFCLVVCHIKSLKYSFLPLSLTFPLAYVMVNTGS